MFSAYAEFARRNGNAIVDNVVGLLDQAADAIEAYAGREWTDDTVPDPVVRVAAAMVERAVGNPTGVTQQSAGAFAVSYGPEAASRLYLTAAEKRVVRRAAGRSNVGVVGFTRGPVETGRGIDQW